MREIRPICEAETEEFLALLCDCFDLDMARARGVFFTEPFFNLNRKWALFEQGEIRSILTTTPLHFGWGDAVGIAGVATHRHWRKRGFGQALLEEVLHASAEVGEGPALLFAHETTVYERVGFQVYDQVIQAEIKRHPRPPEPQMLSVDAIQTAYTSWAAQSPHRLRRDDTRWRYWQWVPRPCESFGGGYLCQEGLMCREAVSVEGGGEWPVMPGTHWFGLRSLATQLGVPLRTPGKSDLMLMGRGFPALPEMFMTDQF